MIRAARKSGRLAGALEAPVAPGNRNLPSMRTRRGSQIVGGYSARREKIPP